MLETSFAQLRFAASILFGTRFSLRSLDWLIASLCEQGHLHFEVSQGLLEVSSVETATPALAGEAGTIVATPFYPYRETTLLLRYDTGDVVKRLVEPLTCRLCYLPATSRLQ